MTFTDLPSTSYAEATQQVPTGALPFTVCRADPRLSYTAFVPSAENPAPMPPTVIVHGSARTPERYRDAFAVYAQRTGSTVIAPLFPCGLTGENDTESYKFVLHQGIRFDLALLDMISQMQARYPDYISDEGMLLHGFSGGGQFAHRFAYLHADRLLGLSVGAPGKVTLIDKSLPWWRGLDNLEELAGRTLTLERLRKIPVQLVIGALDTLEEDVVTATSSPHWMDGINDAGRTRDVLMASLEKSWRDFGLTDITLDIVPDVAHSGFEILDPVIEFFENLLTKHKLRENTYEAD